MSDNTTADGDGADQLIRGLVAAMSDDGDSPIAMATTDAEEVIKSQLTENTGRHLLDSGMYGRHWEENQDNPPWEQPEWDLIPGPVHNVYHFMQSTFGRNRACVAVEAALYAYGNSDDRKRDSWHTISKDFAEAITDGHFTEPMLRSLGLPEEFVGDVLQVQREAVENVSDTGFGRHSSDDRKPTFVANTYNHEVHSLSQCLQGVSLGGPYAEYALIQVHGGADIRGGYTGPRVYTAWDGWFPHELSYDCRRLDWYNAESCCFRDDRLVFVSDIADVPETLIEEADERGVDLGDDVEEHPAVQNAYDANERGYMDGAGFIFLDGDDDEDGDLGFLSFA